MDKKAQLKETFYTQETDQVLEKLGSSLKGLTSSEAEKRLSEYGENQLDEGKTKSLFVKFLEQFKDFMIIVLLAAALISGAFGDIADAVIILVVVIINAILGVAQEAKAEQAINALKEMASPEARVRRDGMLFH